MVLIKVVQKLENRKAEEEELIILDSSLSTTENELKKRMEELSEAKKRLELALEITKMGTWDWDVKSNTQTWDDNLFHLVGISRNEFNQTYKGLIELSNKIVPPEDNKKMQEAIQRVLEGKTDIYELEHRVIKPDGSISYFSVKGRTFRDSEGNLLRMIGTTQDITDRKEAESLFLQNFKGIAYHMDMNYKPLFMEGDIEKIIGYSSEELVSEKIQWEQLVEPEDWTFIYEKAEKNRSIPNHIEEYEYRIRHRNGEVRWVHEILLNLCDETGIPSVIQGIIYDITEQKIVEEK